MYSDSDEKVSKIYLSDPKVWISLLAIAVLCIYFNRNLIGEMFPRIFPAPADSVRGMWVGEMTITGINSVHTEPYHRKAAVYFDLQRADYYLSKYSGPGEIKVAGFAPQAMEINNLWLGTRTYPIAFETGIWTSDYKKDPKNNLISGGFEGTFSPGSLFLKRQTGVGYEMSGVFKKGTKRDYDLLIQKIP
jgi:hypothetical protein